MKLEELEVTKNAIKELEKIPWAKGLLEKTAIKCKIQRSEEEQKNAKRTLTECDMSQISETSFEIRFAHAIKQMNLEAEYEFIAHGKNSVDFKVCSQLGWLIELTSPRMSDSTQESIVTDWYTPCGYQTQSEPPSGNNNNYSEVKKIKALLPLPKGNGIESTSFFVSNNTTDIQDIIKIQNAILDKVKKFPLIEEKSPCYHVIVIDIRSFFDGNSDRNDYINILYGSKHFKNEAAELYAEYWTNQKTRESELVKGIFDSEHPSYNNNDHHLNKKIHAVMFINEQFKDKNLIASSSILWCNPCLSKEIIANIQKTWIFLPVA